MLKRNYNDSSHQMPYDEPPSFMKKMTSPHVTGKNMRKIISYMYICHTYYDVRLRDFFDLS